jgi:hypothetical protein
MRIINTSTGYEVELVAISDIFTETEKLGVLPTDVLSTGFVLGEVFIRNDRTGDVLHIRD